ncbi:MAG: glycoside hydrolase family 28 protein [Bacillus sp. (in: Bacteria)]|nr:glycoside hydrolase family 28 protein [Bacillus sp. (in: firmicutes)]MCM1427724.1 glycoside hydrolase family 28 protein [Eubacterium sp.]
MDIRLIMKTARSVTFELDDGGKYETAECYKLFLNDEEWKETNTVITSLYDLEPDTKYALTVKNQAGEKIGEASFRTDEEFVTINVKELGAVGDGVSDDTNFIQAAIMACPPKSRVLVPKGKYKITSIFLKSGINLEIAKGAELLAETDRNRFVKFPGLIESYDEKEEYNLGTWEGNPLPMFAGIVSGIGVSDVKLYGEGIINGCASKDNWWNNPKVMNGAFRPRMLFLNHCERIQVQGLTFCNSPAWVIHPYFSNELMFAGLKVKNPQTSPNTDGLDPESCRKVEIAGVHFSLGDDCIAVKSGKVYMGKKHKTPSEDVHISHCLMEDGHGAVTVGSEIGAGVRNMVVEKCRFSHTDRGLRIKTRRGRGEDSILDEIIFRDIEMNHVMTPFTANAFYFCDPDGRTEYVQSREPYPVDERTPAMKHFLFENIHAENCHVAAAFFEGLPEQKIEKIEMRNCAISFTGDAKSDVPIMSNGVEACMKKGLHAVNVEHLLLENVTIEGVDGEELELQGVDKVERK